MSITATTAPPASTLPPPEGVIAAVDWRNTTYEVACGSDTPASVTLVGGRWRANENTAIAFLGATPVPGRGDVVVANLYCLSGNPQAPVTSTILSVMRAPEGGGAPAPLGSFVVPATEDITVLDDGTIRVGYPGEGGYEAITIAWDGEIPTASEPVAADDPGTATPSHGLDDPTIGLSPTTTVAVEPPSDPVPASCVAATIAPDSEDRAAIAAFQLALAQRGYDVGDAGVDGYLGPSTQAALSAFVADQATVLLSFAGGEVTILDDAASNGVVALPILDALGIGCLPGETPA